MTQALPRLLMIALDAADPVLIERWTTDGTLPHLGALRRDGVSGRLNTSARYLAGSPWPTFYTSQPPSRHGVYHDYQWRPETMAFAAPSPDWVSASPFWRHLGGDLPVVSYDVPMSLGAKPFNGLEIASWATHDKLAPPDSHPPELLSEIERKFGRWHIRPEQYGPAPVDELLSLRDQLLDATRRSADLALWLLQRPWRLAIVSFSALHRGGHRLFDRSSIAGPVTEAQGESFDRGLRDLYVACDAALGQLMAAAPDATVIAFSVHGMMANTSRADLLDDMLARVLAGRSDARARQGALRRLGERIPIGWRRAVTSRIPTGLRDRLVTMWSAGGVAWEQTRAFALRSDLHGYIRVNLQGREQRGIVPRGPSFESLCDQITEGLLSFRDSVTGEAVVTAVERIDRLYAADERRDDLPDLVVRWSDAPAANHIALDSPRFGRVTRATPGQIPNGRSGNHRDQGFFSARGPGIVAGTRLGPDANILDLAPTAVRVLGAHASVPLAGRVLPQVAPPS